MAKLIKYYAPWCQPCATMASLLHTLGIQHTNVNIDELSKDELVAKNIRSIPVLDLVEDDGTLIRRLTGKATKQELETFINGEE